MKRFLRLLAALMSISTLWQNTSYALVDIETDTGVFISDVYRLSDQQVGMVMSADMMAGVFAAEMTGIDITADFVDPNFLAAVRFEVGKYAPEPILDTDVAGIANLDVAGRGIQSLAGIEHFTSLENISCEKNQLTSIPMLPANLKSLFCPYNQLTSLPMLPSGLEMLSCFNNQLTSLPTLPSSLTYLACFVNPLTSLPSLPSSLTALWCGFDQLTSLPSLPSSLTVLSCSYNQLTSLPTLPSSLTYLDCSGNQLTSLPTLPTSLTDLTCFINQLTSLPALPSSLTYLSCFGNQLTSLPALPSGLSYLSCSLNRLTGLNVSGLSPTYLDCRWNYMASESAVIGFTGTWDGVNYIFAPQNTSSINPVSSIIGVPSSATVGIPLTLTGTVYPSDATNQTIKWSVADSGNTGAVIHGNTFTATTPGTAVAQATITDGLAVGVDFTCSFNITVEMALANNTVTYQSMMFGEILFSQTKIAGQPLTLIAQVPVRAGYDFLGWSTASGATEPDPRYAGGKTYEEDRNLALYAVWRVKSFTVSPQSITVSANYLGKYIDVWYSGDWVAYCTSDSDWLYLTDNGQRTWLYYGSGEQRVSLFISQNTAAVTRTGTVTFFDQNSGARFDVMVTQRANVTSVSDVQTDKANGNTGTSGQQNAGNVMDIGKAGWPIVSTTFRKGTIHHIAQSSKNKAVWDDNEWPEDYREGGKYAGNASSGCTVACHCMALSWLGVEFTPVSFINAGLARANNFYVEAGETIAKEASKQLASGENVEYLGILGSCSRKLGNKNGFEKALKEGTSNWALLDQCLRNFVNQPDVYSPPIVRVYVPGEEGALITHTVIVTGKDASGYRIVDSASFNNTYLKGMQYDKENCTYDSNHKNVTRNTGSYISIIDGIQQYKIK